MGRWPLHAFAPGRGIPAMGRRDAGHGAQKKLMLFGISGQACSLLFLEKTDSSLISHA